MVCEKILGKLNSFDVAGKTVDYVDIDWDDAFKKIHRKTTAQGREIGIRMAIGARKRDIIGQFLIEAAVVSCFGGIIGIVLGCFLSAIIGNLLLGQLQSSYMPAVEQITVLPSVGLVIGAFLFSALLGIVFGLYPANKASNLEPEDALRTQ